MEDYRSSIEKKEIKRERERERERNKKNTGLQRHSTETKKQLIKTFIVVKPRQGAFTEHNEDYTEKPSSDMRDARNKAYKLTDP